VINELLTQNTLNNMPGRDKTGPMGQGPVTGRGAGLCTGFDSERFAKGAGYGAGRRFGMGRGLCFDRGGGGRGFRRFGGFGFSFRGIQGYPQASAMTREDEISFLKSQAEKLVQSQKEIEKRLNELEKEG
jgi:hypothetical protein